VKESDKNHSVNKADLCEGQTYIPQPLYLESESKSD
jgi:hypothetical protein